MGCRNNRTFASDFGSIRQRRSAWEGQGAPDFCLHCRLEGCATRNRVRVSLAVSFYNVSDRFVFAESQTRYLDVFTFSNTSTSYRPRESFLSIYAVTSPAIPVPITATVWRGLFASMMMEETGNAQVREGRLWDHSLN